MDLEKISVKIRPRQGFEAIDLGFIMARNWYFPMLATWLAVALPVYLLLQYLLWAEPLWLMFVFWFFKPYYERLALYYLSRRLFGDKLTAKQLFKKLLPISLGQFVPTFLLRFSVARSFEMAVLMLEQQTAAKRAARLRMLKQTRTFYGLRLTLLGVHAELVIYLSLIAVVYFFLPQSLKFDSLLDFMANEGVLISHVFNFAYFMAMAFFAPFYIAAGFSLYLNQRTWLEAWDIELSFKRIAKRLQGQLSSIVGIVVTVVFVAAIIAMPAQNAHAQTVEKQQLKQTLNTILEGEEYGQLQYQTKWHSTRQKKDEQELKWLEKTFKFLVNMADAVHRMSLLDVVSSILKWVIYITLAALVVYLLYFYRHSFKAVLSPNPKTRAKAASISHILPDTQPLPTDVTAQLELLIGQHKFRQALALLYKATLLTLVEKYDFRLANSLTEGEFLQLAAAKCSAHDHSWLSLLMSKWLAIAYAHQNLSQAEIKSMALSWQKWQAAG